VGFGGEDGTGDRLLELASRHRATIAVTAITLAAAGLRFATLGDQSLDHDETVTAVRVIHDNFFQTMGVVVRGERSPPLYYALAWVWSRVFGTGAIALRSLSAVFGTLTIAFVYLAGRELASRRAGLIAAALVAFNPYLIWYSQEARSYGTLVMLGAVALYFFARARRHATRQVLFGWAIASSLALLTHYFAVFFIVPEALLLLLWSGAARRRVTIWAIALVAAVGVALAPLATVQEGTGRGNGFTQFPVAQRAETALVKYATVEGAAPQAGILSTTPEQRQLGLFAAVVVGFALVLVAARGSKPERRSATAVGGVAVAAFGIPLLMAWSGFDFVDPRNLIGALVPALVALGIAFGSRGARSLGIAGALGCATLFLVALHAESTTPAMQRHDWRAAAAAIPQRPAAELLVAPEDGRTPLKYYMGRRLDKFVPKHFVGGVATRRIVVVSDYLPVQNPDPRFRLISSHTAPQHWTINVYGSRRPVVVSASRLGAKPIMPQPASLLARGRPILLAAEQRADKQVASRLPEASEERGRAPG
jgi:mannosyltransferase